MTMLDRIRPDRRQRQSQDETVRVAHKDFTRRRRLARLRRGRPLLLVLLAAVVVGVGAWLVLFSSALAAERVSVSGTRQISASRVARVAEVPLGKPLARMDLAAIVHRVEAIPAVRSADVSRSWPHSVRIVVTERTPVAVIDRGTGLKALDRSGHVFLSYAQRPARLPLVRTTPEAKVDALAEAGKVAGSLPASIARRVDYVRVATIDQITLVLKNGPTVTWGSSAESARKAQVLAVLLRQKAVKIDVSVPERPTITP